MQDDLKERFQNWRYRGEDQIAEELRAIAKDLPCSLRQMHLEMAAQIVEQGQFLHPNDFGMAIENADLCARIAALEADKARLMGLVKEVEEGFSGPTAWLERWATHVGNCHGGALCECGLTLASLESAAALAKIKDATDGRVTD